MTSYAQNPGDEVDIMNRFGYCWGEGETITRNSDGTVTFNAKSWGGFASWWRNDDVPSDFSVYSSSGVMSL